MFLSPQLQCVQPGWNKLVAARLAEFPIFVVRAVPRKSPVTLFERQPGIELHITHRGRGALYLNEDLHVQEGRQLVLFSGDCAHQVFADVASGYERTVVCFDRSVVDRIDAFGLPALARSLPRPQEWKRLHLPAKEWQAVEAHVDRLEHEFSRRRFGWETATFGALLELLVAVLRDGRQGPPHDSDTLAQRAISIIDANLDQDLSLTALAQVLRISPKHLSRTFSATTGMSISRYILHQRLKLAKRYLREHRHLSIQAVAARCGFKSAAHFSATFTRLAGVTPSVYRVLPR